MSFLNDEIDEIKGREKLPENVKKFFPDESENNNDIDYDDEIPEDERVQINKKFQLDPEKYQNFTKELYPDSLNFYDFEVFRYDWCVTIINPVEKTMVVIANDSEALRRYYKAHKNQIWVGYNSRNYDVFIMKSILTGINPKKTNDDIILRGIKGWKISPDFRKIQFYDFDIYQKRFGSLKTLEASMGNDIRETEVDFNLKRKLTQKEMRQTVKYNIHDVEQTMEVFIRSKTEFDAQADLIDSFDFNINKIGKTQAQLAAVILGAEEKHFDDDWKIRLPKNLKLGKYKCIADWFLDSKNHNEQASLEIEIAGLKHNIAWGGIHAGELMYIECNDDEIILDADVGQLYPNLMRHYHLLSRAATKPEMLDFVLDTSMRLKREGKKKEREPYKRQCNIFYGAMGDKNNPLYDPLYRKLVCVYGQVFIVDLIDKIEDKIQLLQSNTDGIFFKVKKTDVEEVKRMINEWQDRTKLIMEYDEYVKYIAKDVNNYIAVSPNGKYHSKGAYVMELSDLSYNLPIVNKAIVDYLIKGIYPEETIKNCDTLKDFQIIVRVSSNYCCGWHNHEYLNDKTFRVFASRNQDDTKILKCKYPIGAVIGKRDDGSDIVYKGEKFADTPEHCFVYNDDVNDVKVSEKLDKRWYIDLAEKRLCDFGINLNDDSLF